MRSLTLLRHAKSDWGDVALRDFDRPLNARGRRAATAVGRDWRQRELAFDHVVASPAARVVETLDGVAVGYGKRLWPAFDRRVYLASTATLIDLIRALPGRHARVLLVGHNPGLEELVPLLTGDDADTTFPTAATAEIAFEADWAAVGAGGGRLERLVRPRDLDVSLGADPD